MKKYITIVALLTAGVTSASALTLDSSSYGGKWLWVWDSSVDAWGYLANADSTALVWDYSTPSAGDPKCFGFSFSYVDGKQVLTSNAIVGDSFNQTWIESSPSPFLHIAENAALTGSDNGIRSGASIYFDGIGDTFVGDTGSYKLDYTGGVWVQGNVNLKGEIVMSADSATYNIVKIANTQQMSGEWDASLLLVRDSKGNQLTYTTEDSLKGEAGYFWLETSEYTQGASYTVKIGAQAIPEPSAFGLLAGLGALALVGTRRRRR